MAFFFFHPIISQIAGLLELPNLGNNQIKNTPRTAMFNSAAIWQPLERFASQMDKRCPPLKRKALMLFCAKTRICISCALKPYYKQCFSIYNFYFCYVSYLFDSLPFLINFCCFFFSVRACSCFNHCSSGFIALQCRSQTKVVTEAILGKKHFFKVLS